MLYEIGPLQLDSEACVLTHAGTPVALGARGVAVLTALVGRANEYVPKAAIMDAAWPGRVVEEANIAVQISAIRRALSQAPGGEGWIETLARRGYRFVGPVVAMASRRSEAPVSAIGERSNLPQMLTSFVGRDEDLAAVDALIKRHRLITITGAGGIGKTRLVQQLLHQRIEVCEHGVAWIDLSGLSDATLVTSEIANALGLQIGNADPLNGLVAALKPKSILLALDNAEHLIDEVAKVVQALASRTRGVRILVTTQMPLKLIGEQVFRLGPLPVPASDVTSAEAMKFGAVRLFVARASESDRNFVLTSQNLPAVIDICRDLDGLALAIEMAAARVSLLGVTQVAASLGERLRVLVDGGRCAPPRQQTLRAALEWSLALLDPAERTVFRRLGVFASGFSLAMAQHVVPDEGGTSSLDHWAVVDALGTLVDRSLVVVDAGDPPRYLLLESPRAYAQELLVAAGEHAAWRDRLAQALLARFERVSAACFDGRVGLDETLAMLEPDLDNARDTLAWLLMHEPQNAMALANPLSLCLTSERRPEQRRLWEATGEHINDDCPALLRANWALGSSNFWRGERPALARRWAHVAIDIFRQLGDRAGMYRSLCALVCVDKAEASIEQRRALAELQELEDPTWPAAVRKHGALAELFFREADCAFDAAMAARQRVLALAQDAGDSTLAALAKITLPDLELRMSRTDDAVRHGAELVAQLCETRDQESLGFAYLNLVEAWLAKGAAPQARAVATKGWPLAVQFSRQFVWADILALLAAVESRPRCAARLLGYGDSAYTANAATRQVNEARASASATMLARVQLGAAEFDRLKITGAKLRDQEIAALAFALADSP